MTFKGTKGEWKTTETNRIIYIKNEDNVLVAELDFLKTLGSEQPSPSAVYYNAQLLSTAPKLLKSLQNIVKQLHNEHTSEFMDDILNEAIETIDESLGIKN